MFMTDLLLHISASPRGTASHSRRIGNALVGRLRNGASFRVAVRDLSLHPPAFTDHAFADASLAPASERDPEQEKALAVSEGLIVELARARALVIDTPMYNFTVPACLKAWVDLVVRPGRTFRITRTGKVGLLDNRPVYLVVSSGGPVVGTPVTQLDFLTPYLRYVLETIGLHDISVLLMDGMRRGPEVVHRQEQAAAEWIARQVVDFRKWRDQAVRA